MYIQLHSMLFYQICDAFKQNKIPYAVVGGYALALHGIVRATIDIDFVLHLKLTDYEKAELCLKKLGLQSRIPVRAQDIIKMRKEYIKNRNLIAWSFVDFNNPTKQIDILINKDLKDIDIEYISFSGRKIPVASLKTLLKLKQEAGRPQDLVDIENIKRKLSEKT